MIARRSLFLQPSTARDSIPLVLLLWCLVPSFTLASPEITCDGHIEPTARNVLEELTQECAMDRSHCYRDTDCNCETSSAAGNFFAEAKCRDGCVYDMNNEIPSIVTETSATFSSMDVPQFVLGFKFFYRPNRDGSTDGILEFYIEQDQEDEEDWPECVASLDEEDCPCHMKWCNEDKTTGGHVIDCSDVDGGALINTCEPPPTITEASSKAEILFWVPRHLCKQDLSLLPTYKPFTCDDDPNWSFRKIKPHQTCNWVGKKEGKTRLKICKKLSKGKKVADFCPVACLDSRCYDCSNEKRLFKIKRRRYSCKQIQNRKYLCGRRTDRNGQVRQGPFVRELCPRTCGQCS